LGLYLVHNLVGQIGGEIVAESPANKTRRGAKFTVSLPIAGYNNLIYGFSLQRIFV